MVRYLLVMALSSWAFLLVLFSPWLIVAHLLLVMGVCLPF
jgi:hypothetical protein